MNSSVYGSSLMVHACANDSQILPATSDAMFIYTILLCEVCYFASLNVTNTFPNSDRPKQVKLTTQEEHSEKATNTATCTS